MWPRKEGLGIRLSYGVDGNGLPSFASNKNGDSSIKFDLPRESNGGLHLHEIEKSHLLLVEGNKTSGASLESSRTSGTRSSHTHRNKALALQDSYVPNEVLDSCLIEDDALNSSTVFDPTYGHTFATFSARTKSTNFTQTVAAYVNGELGNVLNFSILQPQRIETIHLQTFEKSRLLLPDVMKPYQICFPEPIKQIEVAPVLHGFVPSIILIRTNSKIHIIKCYRLGSRSSTLENANLEVEIVGEVSSKELGPFEFVDASFDPNDFSIFTAVNSKGKFGIWKIPQKVGTADITKQGPPDISTMLITTIISDLSKWKRIVWARKSEGILVITRSSITEFKVEKGWTSKQLVTSNTWSKIIDCVNLSGFLFLLTTKELIWASVENGLQRLLSWKHFLDDSDMTMKLSAHKFDDGIIKCLVFSSTNPLILVYTFTFKEGKAYSLRDPYYIKRSTQYGELQQVALYELNQGFFQSMKEISDDELIKDDENDLAYRKFGLFEVSSTYSLSLRSLSEIEHLAIKSINSEYIRVGEESPSEKPFDTDACKTIAPPQNQIPQLKAALAQTSYSNVDQIEAIQEYAFSLGEGAFKLKTFDDVSILPMYLSLLDISEHIPYHISDVAEIDLMIEQLTSFFIQKQIDIFSIISKSFIERSNFSERCFKGQKSKNIEDLHMILKNTFLSSQSSCEENEFIDLQKASVLMGSSLIKAKYENFLSSFTSIYEKTYSNSSSQVKDLLNEWETTDWNFQNTQADIRYDSQSIISSMPSIRTGSQGAFTPHSTQMKGIDSQHQKKFHRESSQMSTQHPYNVVLDSRSQTQNTHSTVLPSGRHGSQKRFKSSQTSASQHKGKKKKKGGFV